MDQGTLEDIPKSIGGIEGLVSVCCDFTSIPLDLLQGLGRFYVIRHRFYTVLPLQELLTG